MCIRDRTFGEAGVGGRTFGGAPPAPAAFGGVPGAGAPAGLLGPRRCSGIGLSNGRSRRRADREREWR
eukprot:10492880-Alexandrium_andersonii.AAC.1